MIKRKTLCEMRCYDCKRKATTWKNLGIFGRKWFCAWHKKERDNYRQGISWGGYGNCGR